MNKIGFLFFLLLPFLSLSQQFKFKKELKNYKKGWNEIVLDADIYKHASKDLSDLRILGINAKGDTLEAPYILKNYSDEDVISTITCKPYNKVNNGTGFYATFKVPNKAFISSCKLLFANINYDWLVQLEGSNDETNWYTITENQRIINIDNETIEFDHSILEFEPTNYSYYRIRVKNPTEKVTLEAVTITTSTPTTTTKPTYKISPKFKVENKNKTTYIDIKLVAPVPIYSLSVKFSENIDFYRPATISYGSIDTNITDDGFTEHFENETSTIFTSTDKNPIIIGPTITDHILIAIENGDNMPLEIGSIELNALNYKLITRISKSASYALYYGDNELYFPQYDIVQFEESIPTNLNEINLSEEDPIEPQQPLASNKPISKVWLWIMMFVLIGLLFLFSVKMLKK
jgi:Protein of unknown function (DUF3999)